MCLIKTEFDFMSTLYNNNMDIVLNLLLIFF